MSVGRIDAEVIASKQDYPDFKPVFDFNFAAVKKLDSRITYNRSGPASYVDENGFLKLVGDNVPRFDHDPITRQCGGLLIEPERVNCAKYSSEISKSPEWNRLNCTVVANQAVAPDGTTTAALIYPSSSGSGRGIEQVVTIPSNGTYTNSFFVKDAGWGGWFSLYTADGSARAHFNIATAVKGTQVNNVSDYTITEYRDGWYRVTATKTNLTTSGSEYQYIYFGDSDGSVSCTANGTNGLYVWGAQVENGAYATSYFDNEDGTTHVTRGADYARIDGTDFTDLIKTTEVTMIAEYNNDPNGNTNDGYVLTLDDGSGNNRVGMVNNNGYQLTITTGGSSQGSTDNGTLKSGHNKISLAYKVNDSAVSLNGVNAAVDSGCSMPAMNYLWFGNRQGSYDHLGSTIARVLYYPKRLPNSQLKTLSA